MDGHAGVGDGEGRLGRSGLSSLMRHSTSRADALPLGLHRHLAREAGGDPRGGCGEVRRMTHVPSTGIGRTPVVQGDPLHAQGTLGGPPGVGGFPRGGALHVGAHVDDDAWGHARVHLHA